MFQGEKMQCENCKRCHTSKPNVSSQWTVLEVDGRYHYVCPQCFGNLKHYWKFTKDECWNETK